MTEILSKCVIRIACENNYIIYKLVLSPDCDVKIKKYAQKSIPKNEYAQ